MPLHGVTSLLHGNCSLSLAPCRPQDREELSALLCYIEDLPDAALAEAVPWNWEQYRELVAEVGSRQFGVNIAGMVGHTPLRLYVMGAEAWERPASDEERTAIAALADECMAAGAFGMSTSIGFDEDRNKRPVPSRVADDAEFAALIDVLADRGRFLQFISDPYAPRTPASVRRLATLCMPRKVVNTWINVMHDDQLPDLALSLMDLAADLQARRLAVLPADQSTADGHPGELVRRHVVLHHEGELAPHGADDRPGGEGGAVGRSVVAGGGARRLGSRAVHDDPPSTPPQRSPPVGHPPEHEVWLNRSLADLVEARGGHPSDVLADWILDNDLRPGVVGTGVGNGDADGVAALLNHPAGVLANSDAGAHLQMFSAAGDTTLLLTRFTRDRGDMSVEQAVHKMTGRLADLFGFQDRGVLREGAVADVNVFALDELQWTQESFVADLPTGARRLRRPAGNYRVDGGRRHDHAGVRHDDRGHARPTAPPLTAGRRAAGSQAGSFGRPRARSPTMLRCTSLLPP